MTMGIEHFRTLVLDKSGLDDRHVTIGDDNGRQTIEAPKSFQGRVVAWIKTKIFGELPTEGVIRANQTARGVFYDALVKSHGKEIADKALRKVYGYEVGSEEGLQFRGRTTTLQGSTVKRLLEVADKYRGEHQLSTAKKVVKFVKDGNLFEAMQAVNLTVGHPGITGREEGLRRKFDELVRMHPDFARREFTDNDMIDIAYKACSQYIDDLKQNFDDRFPELAKLDNGIVHDARSYFQQLRDLLQGTLNRLRLTEPDEAK